jgi:hypothetical protein
MIAVYLLSRWYTKKELSLRSSLFYGGLLISNAFGAVGSFLFIDLINFATHRNHLSYSLWQLVYYLVWMEREALEHGDGKHDVLEFRS